MKFGCVLLCLGVLCQSCSVALEHGSGSFVAAGMAHKSPAMERHPWAAAALSLLTHILLCPSPGPVTCASLSNQLSACKSLGQPPLPYLSASASGCSLPLQQAPD